MPEVKNCLSCKWEPEWARDEYGTTSGLCKFTIEGAPIIKREAGRLDWRSSDGSIRKFSFDCPAHTPKEQE